jgi:hypothetical protein
MTEKKMTAAHRDDVLESMVDAQATAVRYRRYRNAQCKYLAKAQRLSEVAANIAAQIERDK